MVPFMYNSRKYKLIYHDRTWLPGDGERRERQVDDGLQKGLSKLSG